MGKTYWIKDILDKLRDTIPHPDKGSLLKYTLGEDAFFLSPLGARLEKEKALGADASIDLRLGCYFILFSQSNISGLLDERETLVDMSPYQTIIHVPVGTSLCVQPGEFVLGVTWEWLRIPANCSAYVVGKSSVGRSGLIIETAGMVHPMFSGCLTLEISNLSGVPIHLYPTMRICQLVLHDSSYVSQEGAQMDIKESQLEGKRKPKLGSIANIEKLDKLRAKAKEMLIP